MFDLNGRVAVVTGGNGGIGLGMARGLARAGATVVVAARNADKSARAVEGLRAAGASAVALTVDVTDEASVKALFEQVAARFGGLDVLVNNAGTNAGGTPETLSASDWQLVIDTNLTSAFLCSREAYPLMQRQGGGKIVCVGSMMSLFGHASAAAYAASKGGIVQLTRSLACAWAKDNIQANAVLPGYIETELTDGLRAAYPQVEEAVTSRTPAGRWGSIDDLAGVAVFLASSASDFVTGAAIPVDGGYAAQG